MTSTRDVLVPDMLAERAHTAAGGAALILDGGSAMTFDEWHRSSNRFARGLVAHRVAAGELVALHFDAADWLEYAIAFFGTLKAGAVAVPLPTGLAPSEVVTSLDGIGCSLAVVGPQSPGIAYDVPSFSYDELVATECDDDLQVARSGSDLAQILHTSGATGTPKHIGASHHNVLDGWTPQGSIPHNPTQFFVHAAPIGTNAGQVTMLHSLLDKHTTVVMQRFDSARYCEVVSQYAATHTLLVPATAAWLVESPAAHGADLSCVRQVAVTSAPAAPSLLTKLTTLFAAADVMNCYTSTEAWPARTVMRYDPRCPTSVGRPVGCQQVAIVGPDMTVLGAGAIGEVALSTGGVETRRYVDDTDATRSTFLDGWVRTGDLGYIDEDGFLHLVGRQNDLINNGGMNVAPIEVEAVLLDHPDVAEAAVVGLPHPVLGEMVVAAVVAHGMLQLDDVREFARARLADYKVPARIVRLDMLPRNSLQKVVKPELRRILIEGDCVQDPHVVPARTSDEELLTSIWCQVLGRNDIGIDDNFVVIGGHSLAAFEIVARAGRAVNLDLPASLVLATPTIRAQAQLIEQLRANNPVGQLNLAPIQPRAAHRR